MSLKIVFTTMFLFLHYVPGRTPAVIIREETIFSGPIAGSNDGRIVSLPVLISPYSVPEPKTSNDGFLEGAVKATEIYFKTPHGTEVHPRWQQPFAYVMDSIPETGSEVFLRREKKDFNIGRIECIPRPQPEKVRCQVTAREGLEVGFEENLKKSFWIGLVPSGSQSWPYPEGIPVPGVEGRWSPPGQYEIPTGVKIGTERNPHHVNTRSWVGDARQKFKFREVRSPYYHPLDTLRDLGEL